MATIELNHIDVRANNGVSIFAGLRGFFSRRAVYRQTVRELALLSDRDLSDLGISRSDIRSVAKMAAAGK